MVKDEKGDLFTNSRSILVRNHICHLGLMMLGRQNYTQQNQ
jgi:hypothetical protein